MPMSFQVRPMGDALFVSKTEPWSQFLTGKVGGDPGYDPLAFWVTEAHKRGWNCTHGFNPYRAGSTEYSNYPANHVSKSRPEYVLPYGKSLWLDPGTARVNAYVRQVVMDVVRRYDIDGVHFDDYFYPYGQRMRPASPSLFPTMPLTGSIARWRKSASGRLAAQQCQRSGERALSRHQTCEAGRVKFGISPFGIWRSGSPPGVRGLNAVD
jgi:hypothetical protein